MSFTVSELITWKYPDAQFTLRFDEFGDLVIDTWYYPGVPQPTMAEVYAFQYDADFKETRAKYLRVLAPDGFKNWSDYFPMIADDYVNGTTTFQDHILNVMYAVYPLDGVITTPPDSSVAIVKRMVDSPVDKAIVIANNNTSQSISGTSKTTVSFNTESYDAASAFSSNVFTAPSSGVYEISVFCDVDNVAILSLIAAYEWQLYVTRAGSVSNSTLIDKYTHGILAALRAGIRGNLLMKLEANDTVKIEIQKTSSAALNIYNSYLNIKKVSN